MQNIPRASPIDRRVQRTRQALQHAFLKLIVEKGYDQTTIQDICEHANLGRSTFYLHYQSKEDLKRAGLDHLKHALLEGQAAREREEGTPRPLAFSLAMFEHAHAHVQLYRALVGTKGGNVALDTIRSILTTLVRDDPCLPPEIKSDPVARSVVIGAFMQVLTVWLDSGATTEVSSLDAAFRRYVLQGVAP